VRSVGLWRGQFRRLWQDAFWWVPIWLGGLGKLSSVLVRRGSFGSGKPRRSRCVQAGLSEARSGEFWSGEAVKAGYGKFWYCPVW